MVRQFHDGILAQVHNDGEYSEPFPVTNEVKQSKKISNYQELIQSDSISCSQNQKGNN